MPRCSFNARDFALFLECVKVTNKFEKKDGINKKHTPVCVCVCTGENYIHLKV